MNKIIFTHDKKRYFYQFQLQRYTDGANERVDYCVNFKGYIVHAQTEGELANKLRQEITGEARC